MKIIVLVLLSSMFFKFFIENKKDQELLKFLLYAISIKAFLNICLLLFGVGSEIADGAYLRGNAATTKNLMHIPIVFYISSLLFKIPNKNFFLFAIFSTVALFSYSSRAQLVLTFFIILVIIVRYGFMTLNIKSIFYSISFFLLMIFSIYLTFNFLAPGMGQFTFWKLSTTFTADLTEFGSAQNRIFEIINIYDTLTSNNALLFGLGWGSFFTDSFYPFINYYWGKSAYPLEVFESGKIYYPHGIFIILFLKTGLIGLVFYFKFALNIFIRGINSFSNPYLVIVSFSILPLLYKFNSFINIFILSILIALFSFYNQSLTKHEQ